MTPSAKRPIHPYLEYGGLSSVPGPFRCRDAKIVVMPLKADATALDDLCSSVLGAPAGGPAYERVGKFVLLSFGSMTVASESTLTSPLFKTTYASMGASAESHVALWVPVVARDRGGPSAATDRYAVYLPVMWVDNPVSLVGGREIYGIAKQWGRPAISPDYRRCTLDVYGGAFGATRMSGPHRLLDIVPGNGAHPVEMARLAAEEARQMTRDGLRQLTDGQVDLPGATLLHTVATDLVNHQIDQVAVRQLRTPADDGADGSAPELIGLTTRFHSMSHEILGHGFHVTVTPVASHPLREMFGVSTQEAAIGVQVNADFTLSAA